MQQDMEKAYRESVEFWDGAYAMSEEEKSEALKEEVGEDDWKGFIPSAKILNYIEKIADSDRLLDYGCGYGWAAIAAAKSGCKDVTAVEVVKNGVDLTRFYSKIFGVDQAVKSEQIDYDWLAKQPAESYDALFCGNVLDVIPMEAAKELLWGMERVLKKGARVVLTMNYYAKPQDDPERNIEFKEGRYLFVNGVLRMMSLTDEEWKELLSEYFNLEQLEYFAWPGEEQERRRLFYLTKK